MKGFTSLTEKRKGKRKNHYDADSEAARF